MRSSARLGNRTSLCQLLSVLTRPACTRRHMIPHGLSQHRASGLISITYVVSDVRQGLTATAIFMIG